MILRRYIKCCSCDGIITARIQVGHEDIQQFHTNCPFCQSEIGLSIHTNQTEGTIEKFTCDDNCVEFFEDIKSSKSLYMSTGIPVSSSMIHKDFYMPSLQYVMNFFEQNKKEILSLKEQKIDMRNYSLGGDIKKRWQDVKKMYQFFLNEKEQLLIKHIQEYNTKYSTHSTTFSSILLNFINILIKKWRFKECEDLRNYLSKNHGSFSSDFKNYVVNDLGNLIKKIYFRLDKFFKYSDQFGQVYLVAIGMQSAVEDDVIISTVQFNEINTFYGELFEDYGNFINFYAFINNIIDGRNFDMFKSTDLNISKFDGMNKANKINCFKDNTLLNTFILEYDNQLRNASHHNWITFNRQSQKIEFKSSDSSKSKVVITYYDYLIKCCNLLFQLVAVYMFEYSLILDSNEYVETR